MARNLVPLAAPFLILLCAPRWELAATAACWSVLILPGVLAMNFLFPDDHALGRSPSRFGVASVLSLVPFGVVSWLGCLLHWTLSVVLIIYGIIYLASVAGLVVWWRKGLQQSRAQFISASEAVIVPWALTARGAAAVMTGIMLLFVGVVWSVAESPAQGMTRASFPGREHWWHGTLLAAAGSLIAAGALVSGRIRKEPSEPAPAARAAPQKRAPSADKPPRRTADRWAPGLLWLIAAALTLYVMKAAYALPRPDFRREAWNSDDVTYVSEAVDYSYGRPLGLYEPTLGADLPMSPVNLSPLIAPLVAALSKLTGVECAALHHSVLCPLIVMVGVSALAAALHVVFRGNPWAAPLGLVVILMMLCKSWDYERSIVEFTVWRAMQTKSVHLWLIHPLQLATLILLAASPDWRHLLLAMAVAFVGHLVHPFSTILGAVWCGAIFVFHTATAIVSKIGARGTRRQSNRLNAPAKLLLLLACYGLLGGAYKAQSDWLRPDRSPSSGRVADEAEESRDLVRVEGRPIPRQEPRILFGYDVPFHFGAVAVPMILAAGLRRREWLYVGLLGALAVVMCNAAPLGRLLNSALPTAILWRARWLLPSLVIIAAVAVLLHEALWALLRRHDSAWGALGATAASVGVLGAFAGMLWRTESVLLRIGPPPRELTKLSEDMHGLVDLLGGREADPFVWGTREVTRELPQLMPNIRLVLSREKIMLPADAPDFRQIVLGVREKFRQHALTQNDLLSLLRLYPVDHVVLERTSKRADPAVDLLRAGGWQEVGHSGRYQVWRRESTTG